MAQLSGSGASQPRRVGAALVITAVLFLLALVGILGFVVASAPPAQLDAEFVADPVRFLLYRLGFVSASLVAPALVVMLVLLLVARGAPAPGLRDALGLLFLAMYPPLSSIAYTSQYVLLPRLLEGHPAVAASYARTLTYRDDPFGPSGITVNDFSTMCHREAVERSGAALFTWGSWFDGCTADGVLRRFVGYRKPLRAVIGAWSHGYLNHGSPYGPPAGKLRPELKALWWECWSTSTSS